MEHPDNHSPVMVDRAGDLVFRGVLALNALLLLSFLATAMLSASWS